jgi:HK97 family phage major capsid protein
MGRAEDLREQALAKLTEARALTDAEGNLKEGADEERFNSLMGEFADLDAQRQKTDKTDGNISSAQAAWEFYSGKLTGEQMRFRSVVVGGDASKTPGQRFVESAEFKELVANPALQTPGSKISTSPVVVGQRRLGMQGAASDVINTETGGSPVVPVYRLPDPLTLAQRPLTLRSQLGREDMPSGDTIEYVAQVGFDNAAAAVAQATAANNGAKPQSSVKFEERTAKATWIATWMAMSRQAVSDWLFRSIIDNQGSLMIDLAEEDELLNGSGVAPHLTGILDDGNTGLQTLDLSGLGDTGNLEGFRTARRMVRTGVSRLAPTFALVNPVDSEELDLLKDLEGRYRAGDPFAAGGPDSPPIWRLPRVESEAVAEGTALVGARAGATVYEREPLTIRVAEQHADFFIRNLIVVLFEKREAFPIFFPTAFVEVTLDDWEIAS